MGIILDLYACLSLSLPFIFIICYHFVLPNMILRKKQIRVNTRRSKLCADKFLCARRRPRSAAGASAPQRRQLRPPPQHPAIIWPCITLTRTHDHTSCASSASITCTRGQTRGSLKKKSKKEQQLKKKRKDKQDYLITVWLFFPGINILAEKQTVIERELIKVLLVKAEQKIQA